MELVYAYVALGAGVKFVEWLTIGYRLWSELIGTHQRDYMLPLPSQDFNGTRRVKLSTAIHLR